MKISKAITMDGAWLRVLGMAAITAVLALVVFNGASVHAATKAWDNGGVDNKFSTAENWSDDTVPVAGDVLRFETAPEVTGEANSQILDNDLGIAFGGVDVDVATNPNYNSYSLLNDLNLADGAVWTVNNQSGDGAGVWFEDGANVVAAGDVTFDGTAPYNLEAAGTVTLASGTTMMALPQSIGGLVIENDSSVACVSVNSDQSIDYPITMGGGSGATPAFALGMCAGGGVGGEKDPATLTIADLTLLSDAEFNIPAHNTVDITKLTDNGHQVTRSDGSQGTLKTPAGVVANEDKQTTYEGDKPSQNETVVLKETATLDGNRDSIYVSVGGTLKGEGTVNSLQVAGVVSPGNSPGTITVVNNLAFGPDSTYIAELYSADSYDQLVVSSSATAVTVDGALDVRVEGAISQGDTFTVIDNQSANPVSGTFNGLAEGDRVTVGDAVFSISYVGGDGNDVVLTALTTVAAPGTPNTGVQTNAVNPAVVALTGLSAAGALAVVARRLV